MNWYRELYRDNVSRQRAGRLREDAEAGKGSRTGYFVILGTCEKHLIELVPAKEMKSPYVRENCRLVLGVAGGREGAVRLAEKIVGDVYRETGSLRIREYFLGDTARS